MSAKAQKIEQVDMRELERILELLGQTQETVLSESELATLRAAVETLAFLTRKIEDKSTSLKRLRALLFGPTSEKTRKVLAKILAESKASESGEREGSEEPEKKKPRRKGHGRNGADAYPGLEVVKVKHESLKVGDGCPVERCEGRLYELKKPAVLLRIHGQPPLGGERIEKQRLRCNLCGEIFTARSPEGTGEKKYDEGAVSMMALQRYGIGVPLNRLEQLQKGLGVPLPASTQWGVVSGAAPIFFPIFDELVRQAAQGKVLHNDDTGMVILDLLEEFQKKRARGDPPERTGVYTSGIVSLREDIKIALFFTGCRHAGENLSRVLAERNEELEQAIQMCDALSRNVSSDFATLLCNCMSHARRQVVDVVENFPAECEYLLKTLGKVFKNDARARKGGMSDDERLALHRRESKRPMAEIRLWCFKQFKERLVEPNSGLGKAISYMRKRWRELTRFLFVAGAPLENNLCERVLKKAICHRKNSLFFKTENGAQVGDLFMSLIATCQLMEVNPLAYLTEVQKHADEVARDPASWLPWNYELRLGVQTEPV